MILPCGQANFNVLGLRFRQSFGEVIESRFLDI